VAGPPGTVAGREWVVEPDLSNAAPFLAAALVTGGSVTIPRWRPADAGRRSASRRSNRWAPTLHLRRWSRGECWRRPARLVADLHDVGELTPTLVALAALADSPSRLTGIGHLRGHETDRLAALVTELSGLGGSITADEDGLSIDRLRCMAASGAATPITGWRLPGAVLGLAVAGVSVEDIESTTKTLPDSSACGPR